MANKQRGDTGPRIQIKPGCYLTEVAPATLARITGYSIPHVARIMRGVNQAGEPFIAAVLSELPKVKFEDLFVVVKHVNPDATVNEDVIEPTRALPATWGEALDDGYEPEQGPETFTGSGEYQPDRIVLRDEAGPGIAFEESGIIRLFPTSKSTPWVVDILASIGIAAREDVPLPSRISREYPGRIK